MAEKNPAYKWMESSIGVSVHWITLTTEQDGTRGSFEEAVNGFNVPRFVRSLKAAGADHCIFTMAHAEQYLAFPCEPLESILPGRTTKRDLLGELMDELHAAGIRYIGYYNHSCNGRDDPVWAKACGYADGVEGNLDQFAGNICGIVECIARRYGRKMDGWWFDSCYTLDNSGPHKAVNCDMRDWQFPWEDYIRAAKAGYEDCAVTLNSGVGLRYLYHPRQDYYAGESVELDEPFPPCPDNGMYDHRWLCIDNPGWAYIVREYRPFSDPRFSNDDVLAFVKNNLTARRMTTFNMEIDRSGIVNPKALRQLAEIREQL